MSNVLRPEELKEISKILLIRLGPFGDCLLSTSHLEAIKNRFPGAELHYLVKEPYHKAVYRHPCIDRLIIIPRKKGLAYVLERVMTIARIRAANYDLVIDQQCKLSSQQITFLSGARYRLGFDDGRFHRAYNIKAGRGVPRYNASANFDILQPLGVHEQPYTLFFYISPKAQQYVDDWMREYNVSPNNMILVSAGSRTPRRKKKWNGGNYAQLCDLIIQKHPEYRIVLLWESIEKEDSVRIQSMMGSPSLLAPPTDLEQAAAFLKRCRLLLCNDGGLNHIAVSTATTTLAFFGNTDPTVWSPAGAFDHHHHLYVAGDWWEDDTFGITPEMAFRKVEHILIGDKNHES